MPMAQAASAVPIEALAILRRRLAALPARHPERRRLMEATAQLYAISRATLYRLLRDNRRPKEALPEARTRPRSQAASALSASPVCSSSAGHSIRIAPCLGQCGGPGSRADAAERRRI